MPEGGGSRQGGTGERLSRREVLRASSAGVLATTLTGCGGTERRAYAADPAALAAEVGQLGLDGRTADWVDYERRQDVAGTTLEVVLTSYGVTYDGDGWPFAVGVAATPQAEEAGQTLNPIVDAPFRDLLTEDVAAPLRRHADLGVDAEVQWVRGPDRGGFDESGFLLDTDVNVRTFTGVTDDDEAVVVHAARTIHRNDAVFITSGRARPVDPGTDRPVVGGGDGVYEPDEIEAGLALFLDVLPLVVREEAPKLSESSDSGAKTRVVKEGETLWEIADEEYGDPTKWRLIADANGIDDPRAVEPGTTLVIPNEPPCENGAVRTHVVEEGDTLWEIADEEYGDPTRWPLIADANDIDDPRSLQPGTTLVVPTVESCDDGGDRTHVVEEGDTLWEIADEEYGDPTKWPLIADANDIDDPRSLTAGTELVIPAPDSDDDSDVKTRVFQKGDTLWEIAEQEYGDPTKWPLIAYANGIDDPRAVQPGTTLVIPNETSCTTSGPKTRVFQKGDTLWGIADEEYGDPSKWTLIVAANDIDDPRAVQPGTRLIIPEETSCS